MWNESLATADIIIQHVGLLFFGDFFVFVFCFFFGGGLLRRSLFTRTVKFPGVCSHLRFTVVAFTTSCVFLN